MFGTQGGAQEGTPFDFDAFFRPGGDSGFHHHAHFNFHSMFDDFFDNNFFQDGFGGDFFQGHHDPGVFECMWHTHMTLCIFGLVPNSLKNPGDGKFVSLCITWLGLMGTIGEVKRVGDLDLKVVLSCGWSKTHYPRQCITIHDK